MVQLGSYGRRVASDIGVVDSSDFNFPMSIVSAIFSENSEILMDFIVN